MARLSIGDLPLPTTDFDPKSAPPDAKGGVRFESAVAAEAEDATRATLIRRQLRKRPAIIRYKDARALRKRLSKRRARPTLASARYLHDLRRRIVGAVWKLVRDED